MPKQAEWVSDVEFVLSECIRIREITAVGKPSDWIKHISRDDLLCHLPRSDGGFIICGVNAQSRLRKLATIALRHSDALGTVRPENVYATLCKLIPERFIFGEYEVTQQTVEKVLAAAVKEAKRARSTIKHFVPCRLMYATKPDSFRVGPVTFKTLRAFNRDMSPLYEAYLESVKTSGSSGVHDPYYLSEAQHYYDGFSWVAEVEVLNCDESISKERATLAATTALDILHIIFGAFYTGRMTIAGPRMEIDNRAHMTVKAGLGLHASLSSAATSEVGFGDDWSKFLERPDAILQLSAAERIIEPIVNPAASRPIGLKVADAAAWFGLAVREQTDASRIVKAITALERLVLTDEQEKLAETISQRAAAICCSVKPSAQFDELAIRLKKAYDLRSRLVHGSLSPFDPEVQESVTSCLLLCADVLRAGLVFFSFHKLLEQPISNKKLSAGLSKLVDHFKTRAGSAHD